MSQTWLFKTEPTEYAYDQLERDGSATWDGVANAVALRNLAQVREGDEVLVYHTGKEKAVIGVARATSGPRPDPHHPGEKLLVIDLEPVRRLKRPITLAEIKADSRFRGFDLVRLPRLSVMPVGTTERAALERLEKARS